MSDEGHNWQLFGIYNNGQEGRSGYPARFKVRMPKPQKPTGVSENSMNDKHSTTSNGKTQEVVSPNGERESCPANHSMSGTVYKVACVLGNATAEERLTFQFSGVKSLVKAPVVNGIEAHGRVDGDTVTLDTLGETGDAYAIELKCENIAGKVLCSNVKAGIIAETAEVNVHKDLVVSEGIYGQVSSDSIQTPIIGPKAKVTVRCKLRVSEMIAGTVTGIGKGCTIKVPLIGEEAVVAGDEVTVTDLYGTVRARRLVIPRGGTVHWNRTIDVTGYQAVRSGEKNAQQKPHEDHRGNATVDALNFPGIRGDITFGRLADLFRERAAIYWQDEFKRAKEELKQTTCGLYRAEDPQQYGDITLARWEIRDLNTGEVLATLIVEGHSLLNYKIVITGEVFTLLEV